MVWDGCSCAWMSRAIYISDQLNRISMNDVSKYVRKSLDLSVKREAKRQDI